ncbi:MAG: histidine phosphatase family protein [Propionibacteriaceae bacterium]|nr:histidine phosphatase family protein [Propionibacteriaceae bacterium]
MRLLLIRHGETQANVEHRLDTAYPGLPLSETGRAQAAALPPKLEDEPIEAVYASHLTRAQETAAPLATSRGLEVQVVDGLQEIAAGVEEMSDDWTAYVAELNSWSLENMDSCLEGGETAREFLARFDQAVAHIAGAGHACAALVSHGAALRVWTLTQDPGFGLEKAPPLANTSWIVLNGVPGAWRIESWGRAG